MHCVWLFLGWLRHMFCIFKTFSVMKSNQKVGALPFQCVKTHVASECLGRFVVFFIPGFQSSNFKSTHLYSTMHAWRVPRMTAPRDLFQSVLRFLHRTFFFNLGRRASFLRN